VTLKATDVVYALRIGKRSAVFKALQHLSTKRNVKYKWTSQAKPQKLWDLYRSAGKKFLLPSDRQWGIFVMEKFAVWNPILFKGASS